jgi:hypothetical protein
MENGHLFELFDCSLNSVKIFIILIFASHKVYRMMNIYDTKSRSQNTTQANI